MNQKDKEFISKMDMKAEILKDLGGTMMILGASALVSSLFYQNYPAIGALIGLGIILYRFNYGMAKEWRHD